MENDESGIAHAHNWYAGTYRKIHFDMHTPSTVANVGAGFDAEHFVQAVKNSGAEAVSYFSRCTYGWSYYPTQIGVSHPNLRCDLFGDGTKAMKRAGFRVLAYYAVDYLPKPLAGKHPEWCHVGADGTINSEQDGRVLACLSGAFPREYLLPQLLEIANRYPVDGFFLDGGYTFIRQPCYCLRCVRAYGQPIPRGEDDRRHARPPLHK